jgi:hypothetical protein
MALSDRRAAGPPPVVHGTPCSVATTLSALPPKERDALKYMLDTKDNTGRHAWSERALWLDLKAEGIDVGMQSIGRHRRLVCRCGK